MPQLETSTYLSQIFWLIVSFLSLWFFMSVFVLPRIKDILEKRRQKIDGYIRKAEEINKQALQSLSKYEKALQKARQQAESECETSRQKLCETLKQKQNLACEALNRKRADTEFMLAKEKTETLQAINEISVKLAAGILHKLNIKDFSASVLQSYIRNKETDHDAR